MRKPLSQHPAGGKAVWSGPVQHVDRSTKIGDGTLAGPAEAGEFRGSWHDRR
jgi:hypothetical protein